MFSVHCPVEDAEVLVWSSRITAVTTVRPGVIEVAFRCPCGHTAALLTGRAVAEPHLLHAAYAHAA